jgi:hypothetical protein
MLAVLNGLDMMACDLKNKYLNAPCWKRSGSKVDLNVDLTRVKCVVVCALHGLKSAGASWRVTLPQALRDIGFVSTIADPNVWI